VIPVAQFCRTCTLWHSGGGTSLQGLSNEEVLKLEILIIASSSYVLSLVSTTEELLDRKVAAPV
jgi:hypothetical protein